MTVTLPASSASSAADPAPGWRRSVGLLAVATVGIGVANYLVAIVGVHLLPAAQFSDFAAGQGLLLVLGTGSFAALPWAVARYLARSDDPQAVQKAMHFGLTGSAVQAVALAPVAVVVCWSLGGAAFGLVGGLATVLISLLAGPVGFLQGRHLLPTIAAVRTIETAGRIAATVLLVLFVSRTATWALVGFPVGSLLALIYALRKGRAGFPMRALSRVTALRLTRDAALLGGIQVLLAMLGALDTVYADSASFTPEQAASYQSAALLARVPLFFSAAVATAAYTQLAGARDEADAGRQLRAALRTYLWLAAPFLVAYLTVPRSLLDVLIPARYADTQDTLRALCFAGVLIGVLNVVTTGHQARGRFRTCLVVLVLGVVAQGVTLTAAGRTGQVETFAIAASAVCALTLAGVLLDARIWLQRPCLNVRPVHVVLATGAVAAAFVRQPVGWIALLAGLSALCAVAAFRHRPDDPVIALVEPLALPSTALEHSQELR